MYCLGMTTAQAWIDKISQENIIFYKPDCEYCAASKDLFDRLIDDEIMDNYSIYYVHRDQDISNMDLKEVVQHFGWEAQDEDAIPSRPQIFIDGQLIGGNEDFYNSRWNLGDVDGIITVNDQEKPAPQLKNPKTH
jgi:glutaredoxin